MTIDAYQWDALYVTHDLTPVLPLLDELGLTPPNKRSQEGLALNERVALHVLREYWTGERYQERAVWLLGRLMLDGNPFCVVRNTGRADPYPPLLISDAIQYRLAMQYLFSLYVPEVDPSTEHWLPLSGTRLEYLPIILRDAPTDALINKATQYSVQYGISHV